MGTPDFAVPILAALAAVPGWEVVQVFSQPDRRRGRGRHLSPSPVRAWAAAHQIPTVTPVRLRDPAVADALGRLAVDLVVVAAYGRLLPPALLAVPRLGCVNVHASLLPALRGAAPVAYALLAGLETTGVSIMRMEEGLDTGPVWSQRALPVSPRATCGSLTAELAALGAEALVAALPGIAAGHEPAPQVAAGASWAPALAKHDGQLDWSLPAPELARRVRAFDPWPGAHTVVGGERLGVLEAEPAVPSAPPQGRPGEVVEVDARGVRVAAGAGSLWLWAVRPAGRPAMRAADWARGRRLAAGATVGGPLHLR